MNKSPTYIDGIASSQAIDTAGEIVDLKGLDISSFVGSIFNWEHKNDQPSQIVGKILFAHKIFSKEDCQNERQLMYWEMCQLPFLYVMGRLFDDRKPSSVEVAALYKDDADHPNETNSVGFSIEGAKIEKVGAVITRSIARKLTITNCPANKTCISRILLPPAEEPEDSLSSLFKEENGELFQYELTYLEIMEKKESLKKNVGAGSGAFIGDSLAMSEFGLEKADVHGQGWSKPSINRANATHDVSFQHPKHGTVSISKNPKGDFEVKHNTSVSGSFKTPSEAGSHALSLMARSEEELDGAEFGDLEKSAGWTSPQLKHKTSESRNAGLHFEHPKHGTVSVNKTPVGNFEIKHNDKLVGVSPSPKKASAHARSYISSLGKGEELAKATETSLSPALDKSEELEKSLVHEGVHDFNGEKHHVQIHKLRAGRYVAHASPGEKMIQASGSIHTMHFTHKAQRNGFAITHDTPYAHPGTTNSPTSKAIRSFISDKVKEHHGKVSKSEILEKGMEAGSGNAAPGSLTQGAALAPESLSVVSPKKKKKDWYGAADQAYNTWDKREEFRSYMKKRMPHLANGEVDAIGRVLALKKTRQAEDALSKMYPNNKKKED